MRDFSIITGYELRQQLGKRSVRVTTIILMLALMAVTAFPRLSQMIGGEDTQEQVNYSENQALEQEPFVNDYMSRGVGYVFVDQAQQAEYREVLGLEDSNIYPSREALVDALQAKELQIGFMMAQDGFESIYQDKGLDEGQAQSLNAIMSGRQLDRILTQKGLTAQDMQEIEQTNLQVTETVLGRSMENNILVSMILMIAIYMLVLLYGSTTSVMIAREKDSKAMELLITSTKPAPLILGKVAAAGISGVVQFGLIIAAALGGFLFAKDYYDPALIAMLQGSLSRSYVLTYLYFSLTGYLLYLFLYAALGSTVSRVEDVSSATALVQFIFIAGYVASTIVMYDPAGMAAVITSLIPFTAVMVMPIRAGMMTVPWLQLLLSGALMLVALLVFAWLSIKIYRWGSLNYGNKLSLKRLYTDILRQRKP